MFGAGAIGMTTRWLIEKKLVEKKIAHMGRT